MMNVLKCLVFIVSFLLCSSLGCFAGTNIEFALKLARDGYPVLAQKYLKKINDSNKEGVAKVMCEIELQLARSAPDLKTRTEHIRNASNHGQNINRTPIEKADFSFSLANLIRLGLKEPGLTDAQRTAISNEIIPYFDDAKTQYKAYTEANKEKFEKFIEKAMDTDGRKFLASAVGKAEMETVYVPNVVATMRYFECVVEKVSLLPKGDASRCTDLVKVIEEADTFSYTVEAPVPNATVGTYVARMYGILSDCGIDSKENLEKALEKFKEVLATETNNAQDAQIVKKIKAQAINGMIEMAMRASDYVAALEAIDLYTATGKDAIMPSSNFGIDDFEILLQGLIINAHAFMKAKEDKEREKNTRNIEKLKILIENAISKSGSAGFWRKKLNSYITASSLIMGKEVNDPMILAQLAEDKKNENNFAEAIPIYEKALAGKIQGLDKVNKKPAIYFSLAFCGYKLNKFEVSIKAMKEFFAEFPPADPKFKNLPALKDFYIKSAKLYYNVANKVYADSKKDEDKDTMMKALDILGVFVPDGVVFIKIGALQEAGNFIDAIKLAEGVKKDSVDYDKALYFKGISQFNYSKEAKANNDDVHNEISIKKAQEAIATFAELLSFMKTDPTDIIQEKKEQRLIWEKEAKKLTAFSYLALDDFKNAINSLIVLNEEYKKSAEEKKHSNRLYVLQGMLTCYSRLYNEEKDNKLKQDLILKSDLVLTELVSLDNDAFVSRGSTKPPEVRKKETVNNYKMLVGMMLFTNPAKDAKLTEKGVGYINDASEGKKIENKDLFFARKFLELKNYESAFISLSKVKKEYEDKGMSTPLTQEDFAPVKAKLISDESRSFFKLNFEVHAFQQTNTKGEEIKKNTRDYGRLKRNLEYLSGEVTDAKITDPGEKEIHKAIMTGMSRDKVWNDLKTSPEITKLKKKLIDFLTYLGIIDDLYICSLQNKQFEEAIKFAEVLRLNYPGILAEDKKLANLRFEYGLFLLTDKANEAKAIEQINEALKMYLEIRNRVQQDRTSKLYVEINQKRLLCLGALFKITGDKKYIEEVINALSIMSSNQENYIQYTNVFAQLEGMNQLPENLKPLTPEQIREQNVANEAKDLETQRLAIEAKDEADRDTIKKRRLKQVGTDCSFLHIEMRDLESSTFDLFKTYYAKIQGAPPLKANADERDLVDAFNEVIRLPNMYKMLPKDEPALKSPTIEKLISSLDEYVALQGAKAAGTIQTISTNRLILEACFPQLPKVFEEPK